MKTIFVLLAILLPLLTVAQDAPPYTMYLSMYVKPKPDRMKVCGEQMTAHNKTFHTSASNRVDIWSVVNGPHSGELVYVQGPTTFAQIDAQELGTEHGQHWREGVMPNTNGISNREYWVLEDGLNYAPENFSGTKMRVRFFDIKPGQEATFLAIQKQIVALLSAKKTERGHYVFNKRFASQDGRDIAVVHHFNDWAFLDENFEFEKSFKEVHGEEAWDKFREDWEASVESIEDELRSHVPLLSSPAQ